MVVIHKEKLENFVNSPFNNGKFKDIVKVEKFTGGVSISGFLCDKNACFQDIVYISSELADDVKSTFINARLLLEYINNNPKSKEVASLNSVLPKGYIAIELQDVFIAQLTKIENIEFCNDIHKLICEKELAINCYETCKNISNIFMDRDVVENILLSENLHNKVIFFENTRAYITDVKNIENVTDVKDIKKKEFLGCVKGAEKMGSIFLQVELFKNLSYKDTSVVIYYVESKKDCYVIEPILLPNNVKSFLVYQIV